MGNSKIAQPQKGKKKGMIFIIGKSTSTFCRHFHLEYVLFFFSSYYMLSSYSPYYKLRSHS